MDVFDWVDVRVYVSSGIDFSKCTHCMNIQIPAVYAYLSIVDLYLEMINT